MTRAPAWLVAAGLLAARDDRDPGAGLGDALRPLLVRATTAPTPWSPPGPWAHGRRDDLAAALAAALAGLGHGRLADAPALQLVVPGGARWRLEDAHDPDGIAVVLHDEGRTRPPTAVQQRPAPPPPLGEGGPAWGVPDPGTGEHPPALPGALPPAADDGNDDGGEGGGGFLDRAVERFRRRARSRRRSAEPPPTLGAPEDREDSEGPDADTEPPHEAPDEADAEPAPGAGVRVLQGWVRDGETGELFADGFHRGRPHRLDLRIAAPQRDASVAAPVPFASPTPGEDAHLTVTFEVRGRPDTFATADLVLPAAGDSGTVSFPFAVPPRIRRMELVVRVLHRRRALQGLVVAGPVITPGGVAPEAVGFTGTLDAGGPVGDLDGRSAADVTLFVERDVDGTPFVLDPEDPQQVRRLASANVTHALEEIESELSGVLASGTPATTLEGARGALVNLAIAGRLLRDALAGTDGPWPQADEARWVHVVAHRDDDIVPVELAYGHPMPADRDVPVCAPARAGADRCAADCPDRDSGAVVCPFGFWGVDRVVERVRVPLDRVRTTGAHQRSLRPLASAVVGASSRVANADPTAGTRISASVAAAVAPGRAEVVDTWTAWRTAVVEQRSLLVMVVHTVEEHLEIGTRDRCALFQVGSPLINPSRGEPGPLVLALGCDTALLRGPFTGLVGRLHAAGADLVVTTLAQVPGRQVADLLELFLGILRQQVDGPGEHRFGHALAETRRRLLAGGKVIGLALVANGDGDVRLVGAGSAGDGRDGRDGRAADGDGG